ncbi:SlyX family protein [Succinatimonas hippei]|uniref:SlyX family protein n=1 Tax=Succinatimonas hippei TaxID=626938 RepID=UPI002012F8E6|nr:SlyX family protein [Succinatimonas hippei]MCL1603050.1 SlyX family protein [Succinatimonas hippei]
MGIDDNQLIKMQEKMAWLEDLLEKSGKEIAELEDKVLKLERDMMILSSKIAEPSAVRDLKDETPPPHY